MKISLTLLLSVVCKLCVAQAPRHDTTLLMGALKNPAQIKQAGVKDLLEIEAGWNRSTWTGDTVYLQKLLHPDFRLIGFNGISYTKAETVAFVKDTTYVLSPYRTEDVEIRFVGNVAIITGTFLQSFTFQGKTYKRKIAYTDAYTKTGNKWIAVTAQATLVAE